MCDVAHETASALEALTKMFSQRVNGVREPAELVPALYIHTGIEIAAG